MLVHNFWWRVLALLLAVTIWAMVASEPELSMFATVPLEYRNLPDDLEMSSPPAETVTLELRGPSAELRGLGDNRSPSVVLDMSDAIPGLRTFSIALPDKAEPLIETFVELLRSTGLRVETGRFQAHMLVGIRNDGPVTIPLDSQERFRPRRG